MLATLIVIAVIIATIVLWIISTQRRLVVLDENISNAMSQIGVQLSSRFDALTALLDLTKGYAKHESETLIETIKSRRSVITAKSTTDDVVRTSRLIYNNSVTKLNREIRMFPVSMISGMLGFRQREYLVEHKTPLPHLWRQDIVASAIEN